MTIPTDRRPLQTPPPPSLRRRAVLSAILAFQRVGRQNLSLCRVDPAVPSFDVRRPPTTPFPSPESFFPRACGAISIAPAAAGPHLMKPPQWPLQRIAERSKAAQRIELSNSMPRACAPASANIICSCCVLVKLSCDRNCRRRAIRDASLASAGARRPPARPHCEGPSLLAITIPTERDLL
jgi:hypothetical protein